MMKLKDVYALPSTPVPLTEWVLSEKWFPEVPQWAHCSDAGGPTGDVLQALTDEGLIEVKQLVNVNFDTERYAVMHTLFFKELPVAIIQEAGRSGDDHFKRWVTDAPTFLAMCNYLQISLMRTERSMKVDDPEQFIYPEEVFQFYGHYFGTPLGHPPEPVTKGFLVLNSGMELIPGANPEYVLVTATKAFNTMPEYIRRGTCVLQKVGPVSEDELARNPRVKLVSDAEKHPNIYWYLPASRPDSAKVISV